MGALSGKSRRTKGLSAEREVARELERRMGKPVARTLGQTRDGGCDLYSSALRKFAIEVKRCEKLNLNSWWEQACEQAGDTLLPVVIYRQNRQSWRVMVPMGWLLGLKQCQGMRVEMGLDEFVFLVEELG
jgi:hypothetical protein